MALTRLPSTEGTTNLTSYKNTYRTSFTTQKRDCLHIYNKVTGRMTESSAAIRIASYLPTIENTQLVSAFKATSPQFYTDGSGDQGLLYYGSDTWNLRIRCELNEIENTLILPLRINGEPIILNSTTQNSTVSIRPASDNSGSICVLNVWIFILTESLIIHFPNSDGGLTLSIPHELILMAGIQDNLTSLYLGISENLLDSPVELLLKPDESGVSNYPLFQSFVGLSSLTALQTAYESINECISLTSSYKDEDDSGVSSSKNSNNGETTDGFITVDDYLSSTNKNEEESGVGADDEDNMEYKLNDEGQADDEVNDSLLLITNNDESGMNVDIVGGANFSAVKRTRRDDGDGGELDRKTRKL